MTDVFNNAKDHAKESLKLLELINKDSLTSKAKGLIKIPGASDRKRMTNDKIVASLKKMGIATHEEVIELRKRVDQLEEELALLKGEPIEPGSLPRT